MKYTLSTDTSCDVPRDELRAKGISYVPLTFTIDGQIFEDEFSSDAQFSQFYQKIRDGAMPTTSQITPITHEQYFCSLIENGAKEIVHLCLSGGLSSTYESAVLGAEEAKKQHSNAQIYVVDTISATQAQAYLLKKALAMRDGGKSALETAVDLNYIKNNLQVWILCDDLMHLKRGGRVSAASAVIGTMLKIKPVLIINKIGGLSVVHKVKGTKKGFEYFFERLNKHCANYKTVDIAIAHADCLDAAQELYNMLRQKGCKGKIDIGWIGPVIGSHTGGGTIGIIFEGDPRIQ